MSFENTQCVCGGNKERETLICRECKDHVASTIEAASLDDPRLPWQSRRNAAIRVLSYARKRNKSLALTYRL
jgi:hypothetical protein